jgi:hypothetical protein
MDRIPPSGKMGVVGEERWRKGGGEVAIEVARYKEEVRRSFSFSFWELEVA